MEAFHLLSRGGVKFDKQKFVNDVKLFSVRPCPPQSIASAQTWQGSSHNDTKDKERRGLKDGELPPELDFFRYAAAGDLKRKHSGEEGKARRKHRKDGTTDDARDTNAEDEEDSDSDIIAEHSTNFPIPRHRVTTKGNNAPKRVDTFEELRDRYRIDSQLMGNLKRYGYECPTGIQSVGCPILLEVSNSIDLRQHRANSCSLAIWLLYPLQAQEKHYPTSYQL